jgi:hypothetical protein
VREWPGGEPVLAALHAPLRVMVLVQGQGLGRALLDRVRALSKERDDSRGVTLTTEVESNVALYRHVGYEVVGRGTIAPGLETWGCTGPTTGRPKPRGCFAGLDGFEHAQMPLGPVSSWLGPGARWPHRPPPSREVRMIRGGSVEAISEHCDQHHVVNERVAGRMRRRCWAAT